MKMKGLLLRNDIPDPFEKAVAASLQELSGWKPEFYKLADGEPVPAEGFKGLHSDGVLVHLYENASALHTRHPLLLVQQDALEQLFNTHTIPGQLLIHPAFTIRILFRSVEEPVTMATGRFRALPYSIKKTATLIARETALLLLQSLNLLSNQRQPALQPLPEIKKKSGFRPELKLRHLINQLFFSYKWNIGIIDLPIQEIAMQKGPVKVNWLPEAPGNDFKADPFGWTDGETNTLLYEYFDAATQTGYLKKNDNHGEQEFLRPNFHLSYPFLVRFEGKILLIPESAGTKSTTVYELGSGEPKPDSELLKGEQLVDPTIFEYRNQWWLFCTKKDHQGADLRLYIYHATSPRGPWLPHSGNPVKTDICSARPGGTPFVAGSKLIRPAQDSSRGYGSALLLMEITELTTTTFKEQLYHRLEPENFTGPYKEGIHTLSAMGNKTLIDGKRRKFTLQPFFRLFVK